MTTRIFELVVLVKIWIAVVCIKALCVLVGGYRHVSEGHNVSIFCCKYCGSSLCGYSWAQYRKSHPKLKKCKPDSLGSDSGLYSLERKMNWVFHTRTTFLNSKKDIDFINNISNSEYLLGVRNVRGPYSCQDIAVHWQIASPCFRAEI